MPQRISTIVIAALVGSSLATSPALAQQAAPIPAATPLQGQTGDKVALDQSQCQGSATQTTGFVPGTAAPTPQDTGPSGARVKGAAAGAATGAVVGGIQNNNHPNAPDAVRDEHRGNQASTGAKAGVVAGGVATRQNRRSAKKENEQAADQYATSQTNWQNSYKACLQQRGYSVP